MGTFVKFKTLVYDQNPEKAERLGLQTGMESGVAFIDVEQIAAFQTAPDNDNLENGEGCLVITKGGSEIWLAEPLDHVRRIVLSHNRIEVTSGIYGEPENVLH